MKFHKRINGGAYDYANHLWLPISQDKIAICPVEGVEPTPFKTWTVIDCVFSETNICKTKLWFELRSSTKVPPGSKWNLAGGMMYLHSKKHDKSLIVLDQHMCINLYPSMAHDERVEYASLKNGRVKMTYQNIPIHFSPTKECIGITLYSEGYGSNQYHLSADKCWLALYDDIYFVHPNPIQDVLDDIDIWVSVKEINGCHWVNSAPRLVKKIWNTSFANPSYVETNCSVDHYLFVKNKAKGETK